MQRPYGFDRQILAAVSGKASIRPLSPDGAFLNWIGLDHVASLVEIHIQAIWLGVDQVHVHAADVMASPSLFLDLLSKHRELIDEFRRRKEVPWEGEPLSEMEMLLRADIADIMSIAHVEEVGINTTLFQFGFTSMDVIRLKHRLDTRLRTTVATIVLMKHPTVRSLASALDQLEAVPLDDDAPSNVLPAAVSDLEDAADQDGDDDMEAPNLLVVTETEYDPVVVLRASGTKAPLWLVHPGVGEILVFVGLAQHMRADDRPIYALRARGFEPG